MPARSVGDHAAAGPGGGGASRRRDQRREHRDEEQVGEAGEQRRRRRPRPARRRRAGSRASRTALERRERRGTPATATRRASASAAGPARSARPARGFATLPEGNLRPARQARPRRSRGRPPQTQARRRIPERPSSGKGDAPDGDGDGSGGDRRPGTRTGAPDDRGPRRAPAGDAHHAGHRGAGDDASTARARCPAPSTTASGRRPCRPGPAWAMHGTDRLCVLHRDLAAHLIRGVTPARIFAQYMGREGGITRGRDGNVHFGDRTLGCVGMVSMLPDMMLVATGLAMAFKLRGEQRVALTWFGDGSTSRGDFHEAMNWAGVQRLPVIFVLENNQYAYSTPLDQQFAVDPVERAAALRLPRREGGRQRRRGDVRGHAPGARARAGRRGADDDRGRDHAHARPRRARRHEVRAARADRGVAPQGPDRPPGAPARGGRRRRRRRCARRSRAEIERGVEEALAMPMPDGETAHGARLRRPSPRCSRTAPARWSGFAGEPRLMASHDLPAGDLRRDARGDARGRARVPDGRGHRRVRRRVQGHRRLHRRVRARRA